ncbi:MAG TPA: PEP-CTERM sorting domain-containing protein [Verrucomicrobiae bacterium]|nr:PEP-CTERM sorting domain-containing protein [Verrucomicrobiae bacterium]
MQFELTADGLITNSITSGFAGIQIAFFGPNGVGTGPADFSNKIDSNTPPAQITSPGNLPANGTWIHLDTGVVTAPAGTAFMDVYGISVNVVGGSTWEDNFSLVAVPEPSAFALAVMGLGGLTYFIRRRAHTTSQS